MRKTSRDLSELSDLDLQGAWDASRGVVRHTPAFTVQSLGAAAGGKIVVKAENLQRTGSFKLRGALAKLRGVERGATNGVVAGSAGNHAQALAYAARHHGLACTVFMPRDAPISKVAAVEAFGARVEGFDGSVDGCVDEARAIAEAQHLTFVHPFDDLEVICGQAGVGIEILDDVPDVETIVVPIGGGGLASGIALAVQESRPGVRLVGVQAAACAPLVRGPQPEPLPAQGNTLADGIAIKRPGVLTQAILRERLDDVVTVDDDSIAHAMVVLMERAKLVAEGAGAATVAALLGGKVRPADRGATVLVVSGGNVDARVFASVLAHDETIAGRRFRILTRVPDCPGGLVAMLAVVSNYRGNVVEVTHVRDGTERHIDETGIELTIDTRGPGHEAEIESGLMTAGYPVMRLT